MIVVDASAAAKLVLDESDSARVRDWFRDVEDDLAAPDLLNIEITQAIVRRVNARQTPEASARSLLREWNAFLGGGGIVLLRSDTADIAAAAVIALHLGHPVKDCVYLALAIRLGCDLATCDAKFRDKALAHYPRIRLLADFT